jgi:hypothetical protein
MMVFRKTLVRSVHVRSFEISESADSGWQLFEREDEQVVALQRFTDWHRVERAILRLARVVAELQRDGWHELIA